MRDGLYRVVYKGICAGFVIDRGEVVQCAPVLRRNLGYWKMLAVRISD